MGWIDVVSANDRDGVRMWPLSTDRPEPAVVAGECGGDAWRQSRPVGRLDGYVERPVARRVLAGRLERHIDGQAAEGGRNRAGALALCDGAGHPS